MVVVALLACGSSGDAPPAPLGPIRWDVAGATPDVIGLLARSSALGVEGAASGTARFDTEVPIPPTDALEAALAALVLAGGEIVRSPGRVRVERGPEQWAVRVLAPLEGSEALAGARGADGMAPWGFERTPGGAVFAWCQCSEVPFDAGVAPPTRLGMPSVEPIALDRPAALVSTPGSDVVRVVAVGGSVDGHRLVAVDPEVSWDPPWEVPGTPEHPLRVSPDQLAELTDPARAATLARVIAHRGADGSVDGHRLSAIRRGTSLDQLGLRNGDVVVRVADLPVTTLEEAVAAREALASRRAFCVDLERRGEALRLCYDVGPAGG